MIETFLSLARDGGEDALPIPVEKASYGSLVLPGTTADFPKPKPFLEYGVSGLLRTKGTGYVYDEWLNALATTQAKKVYREMRDNDPVIGAMFFALETILRKSDWRVEPGPGAKGQQYAEFLEQCIEDMSHTWEDFIAECVNMFAFGFALFETVYKRRQGPNGKRSSKYNDGLIGWRKLAPRAQESILYWNWDEEGGLQGAVQLAAPDYHTVPIPIEKLLLFRTTSLKNNPEGRSLLRNCYRPWFFKRRIEEVEGIGIERDLCGLPVLSLTKEAQDALGGEDQAKKLVTGIRRDEQMGVILPLSYDDKGNPQIKLELLRAAGQRQADPSVTIARYNHDILNTMLAGFIEFGQQPSGNRALHTSAKGIFYTAISAFQDSVAGVINRYGVTRLMALNRMDPECAPKLVPGEVGDRDLDEFASYVLKISQAGIFLGDKPTADVLRKKGGLPEQPDDDESGPPAPAPRRDPARAGQDPGERLETAA